jgi:molybdopterin/thiamine biosynthesis adenylyltransferase
LAHAFQVGAGSGGMPVLDSIAREARVTRVTLVEPDIYKAHNVERHLFPLSAVGKPKAELAREWLAERRADLEVRLIVADLTDPTRQGEIEQAVAESDIGICAADNESAKYHFDSLMRKHGKPWTLGEVLSGGIGGLVHWFRPGGPCYGCVASHLKRAVEVEKPKAADYSQPNGAVPEATVPASKAAIAAVTGLHAMLTASLLENPSGFDPGFTSLLLSLKQVPEVFREAFRPYRMAIARSPDCLICRAPEKEVAAEDLDVALSQALARLGHE